MSDATKLADVLARIEKQERSSRFRTFLYTIIPTCLGAILVVSYIWWASATQLKLNKADAAKEIAAKDAEAGELKRQVQGLMKGPVQAYVRPVRFGGEIVVAKDLGAARNLVTQFDSSPVPSVRTKEITEILGTIRGVLANAPDLAAVINELDSLVLQLGKACRSAWENDSRQLAKETIHEFNRVLYERAIETTRKIAAAKDYDGISELRAEFWRLYWGELPLIETQDVSGAMVEFGNALNAWKAASKPADLDEKANAVAKACKEAMN
jgi:hypothetical protein